MVKNNKSNIVRAIPGGRQIEMSYGHPSEYNNWKSAVSYCNTLYSSDDGKRYRIKKNTVKRSFTITAEWLKPENIES